MLKTPNALAKSYGISDRSIRRWLQAGKIQAEKRARTGYPEGYYYLVDEDKFKEFLRIREEDNQNLCLSEIQHKGGEMTWVIENANEILSYFLGEGGNCRNFTIRHLGLSQYRLCIAFHIAGRDDLVNPSFLKSISSAYPIETNRELPEITTIERREGLLVKIPLTDKPQPDGNKFRADLLAFLGGVEQNERELSEVKRENTDLREQVKTLTAKYNKLQRVTVEIQRIMALGD